MSSHGQGQGDLRHAGGRDLRVSRTPTRVSSRRRRPAPSTSSMSSGTCSVEDGVVRALGGGPPPLSAEPGGCAGYRPLDAREGRRRRLLPERSFGRPGLPATARIEFPSGRHADESARRRSRSSLGGPDRDDHLHPWPVRSDDVDHPDELRLDLDPRRTDFDDAVRVAAVAHELLGELGYEGFPNDRGRACTSTSGSSRARRSPNVRHARDRVRRELSGACRRGHDHGGRRSAASASSSTTTERARPTIASAYSVRPKPGAPVSAR